MSSRDSLKEEMLSFEIEQDFHLNHLDEKLLSTGEDFVKKPWLGYLYQLLYVLFLCFQ